MRISPDTPLREAAGIHADAEGLPPPDPQSRWVKIKLGPVPFVYPNTRGRKRVLLAHDLHHLLTGYSTDLLGEGETAAWELGSGLSDRSSVRYAIRVFGFVLLWAPGRLRRAFFRGRQCVNLVGRPPDAALLERSVAEVRSELGLDRSPQVPTPEDERAFRVWASKAVALVWGPLLPLAALAWWWLG